VTEAECSEKRQSTQSTPNPTVGQLVWVLHPAASRLSAPGPHEMLLTHLFWVIGKPCNRNHSHAEKAKGVPKFVAVEMPLPNMPVSFVTFA
jgi:hypothetical protein